jgi:serine/threonine-protein kinase
MLSGLEAAHAAGVVHRDLKPDNVFVVSTSRGPLVKLLDFGIAKLRTSREFQVALTRPGVMMGTPEYMAPEQVYSADSVDARADVYSVGAMLYEMLAGQRPAHGDDAQQIATYIVQGKVVRLNQLNTAVPERLADVVHRAMSPSPTERIASVTDLRDALLPFCGSLSFAGRLAATPAPGGGVAPTWPPDEGPTKPAATEAAGATEARPHGLPPTANATPWQPTPPGPTPSPGPAYGYGAPGYALPPQAGQSVPTAPTRARSPRRLSVWLLFAMIAVAIGIVVMAVAMGQPSERREPERTSTVAPEPPRAPTTAAAAATPRAPTAGVAPPVQPPVQPPTAPVANRPPVRPRTLDAGAEDAAPSIGLPGFPLPFPIPSAIPLPSAFPLPIPIPSGFPPLGLPGFPQAAPAQSTGNAAGSASN